MTDHQSNTSIEPSEDAVRLRSYQIWEREGRPDGCADEHWRRAKAELMAELQEASISGLSADLVLPHLTVTEPPQKIVSGRVDEDRN